MLNWKPALGMLLWALSLVAPAATSQAQESSGKKYMGRVIAPFMTYHGAPWLIRPERELEEAPSQVLEQLKLKPGMVVVDFGCGNGFYTLPMAKQVGPDGKVLAVDIQPEMIQMLKERAANAGVDNIEPILSTEKDTKLPENSVDLLILVDVYHEFSFPAQMLEGIRKSLKDDGVVALLEFRAEDPTVPIRPLHKMSKKQILKEYNANGLKLVREFDGLPWQHLMYFGRDNEWKKDQRTEESEKK
jgi:cyclopropane fatty-acyl-phospholipid synthase-like methyltransferase